MNIENLMAAIEVECTGQKLMQETGLSRVDFIEIVFALGLNRIEQDLAIKNAVEQAMAMFESMGKTLN